MQYNSQDTQQDATDATDQEDQAPKKMTREECLREMKICFYCALTFMVQMATILAFLWSSYFLLG